MCWALIVNRKQHTVIARSDSNLLFAYINIMSVEKMRMIEMMRAAVTSGGSESIVVGVAVIGVVTVDIFASVGMIISEAMFGAACT